MLEHPCKCKGSLSFVHEDCLVKWLTQQNIRRCELCHTNFNFKEEFGSLSYILKKNWTYFISDKRRLIKLCVYSLYIYLFSKRFYIMSTYFKNLFIRIFFFWRKNPEVQKVIEQIKAPQSSITTSIFGAIVRRLFNMIRFLYNLFIVVQLIYLGYAEGIRIR